MSSFIAKFRNEQEASYIRQIIRASGASPRDFTKQAMLHYCRFLIEQSKKMAEEQTNKLAARDTEESTGKDTSNVQGQSTSTIDGNSTTAQVELPNADSTILA